MVQKIFGFGLGGTGIVAVLIIAGIILYTSGINIPASNLAIIGGVTIGIILGGLGIVGVLITLFKRMM